MHGVERLATRKPTTTTSDGPRSTGLQVSMVMPMRSIGPRSDDEPRRHGCTAVVTAVGGPSLTRDCDCRVGVADRGEHSRSTVAVVRWSANTFETRPGRTWERPVSELWGVVECSRFGSSMPPLRHHGRSERRVDG